ncbi:hypothetical protein GCM10007301_07160 [Azorhizobium oxalatiphilum]|uniref:HTH cro/C1-type domain-containing protein n=1 Tax=Azorhizobium oxalatiphilum TaxID=980631 RepID=A0A917F652_9HYPH|nr:Scr1 family TA system antitoxin-like transcriptional regulator [Azorhizobium oxalatiphilum]GGF50349.1 hypothetical protein GCM10007301_07160 [Azorhizobium oxalatiphilum]
MVSLVEVGRRLKAHRQTSGLTVEAAAEAVHVSRALLYRYEAGEIVKLDTLERLARLYGTSLPTLLGMSQDYVPNAVTFFERIEKLEQEADHIITVFGPMAYVLTTPAYEAALFRALAAGSDANGLNKSDAQQLRAILRRRRAIHARGQSSFVNIIPMAEIAAYVQEVPPARGGLEDQRTVASAEISHLCTLIEKPPMGVQVAVTSQPLPTSGFQIIRKGAQSLLVTSPFRLGFPLNLRYGVAVISSDEQAVRLHETLAARLWDSALPAGEAVAAIRTLIRTGAARVSER